VYINHIKGNTNSRSLTHSLTVELQIKQFLCLRSCSLELSTSSHSRPVFITILFLQSCQDWTIYHGLWCWFTL